MNQLSNTPPWNSSAHGDTLSCQSILVCKFHQTLHTDGVYGPITAAAVETVQRALGLQVDGICGPKTWSCFLHLPIPA